MSHTAELIAVGTELLLGNIANTDAQMLSQGLSALGINVYYHTVVGDNPQRLRAAVELAKSRADILITTGGLGPTCDDLTKVAVAQASGRNWCTTNLRPADPGTVCPAGHPGHREQLPAGHGPEGCTVLDNDWGTAPGVAFQAGGTHVLMLPGPPRECAMMFRHRACLPAKHLRRGDRLPDGKDLRIGESAAEPCSGT